MLRHCGAETTDLSNPSCSLRFAYYPFLLALYADAILLASKPRMLTDFFNGQALRNIAVQHGPDKANASSAHNPWHAKFTIQDLIDAVERIFLIDDGVEQDAESPDILFLAAIGFAL